MAAEPPTLKKTVVASDTVTAPMNEPVPESKKYAKPVKYWFASCDNEAGKVIKNGEPAPKVVVVPAVNLTRTNKILLSTEYCAETTPLPTTKFVHVGVKEVHAPAVFNSAAVSTCPLVNVPNVAIIFSFIPYQPSRLVFKIPYVELSKMKYW